MKSIPTNFLCYCFLRNFTAIGRRLLERGSPKNKKNKSGLTALSIATRKQHVEFVYMLVSQKCDLDIPVSFSSNSVLNCLLQIEAHIITFECFPSGVLPSHYLSIKTSNNYCLLLSFNAKKLYKKTMENSYSCIFNFPL